MKCNAVKKFKLWLIITLTVIVAGMFILGFVGFNNPVDFKVSYQVKVDVEEDTSNTISIAMDVTEEFFNKKGISDASYAVTVGDDGTITYKFNSDVADKVDGLKEDLQNALDTANLNYEAKVSVFESTPYINSDLLGIALAAGVSAVVILIYLLIMEKPASALSVLLSAALSALLFVSLVAITRTPALPFATAMTAFTALLSTLISTIFVGKVRDELKNVANDKLSNVEIAGKAFKKSALVLLGVLGASIVAGIVLVAVGTGYLKFLGIQIAIAGISAVFGAGAWTPVIWSGLKKGKSVKKATAEEN